MIDAAQKNARVPSAAGAVDPMLQVAEVGPRAFAVVPVPQPLFDGARVAGIAGAGRKAARELLVLRARVQCFFEHGVTPRWPPGITPPRR